ncbi:hypothetical protein DC20_15965 [Rufibacter tibetensis]|uniref:Uncharacterized protein n=1 Tax=Rufibacter tibetensis TaxID=512763 RepID=A0A0N7HWU0_9BACT|nr:hypothetical protein DC20_15965 [Rufibacter tibetensis]
MCFLFARIGGKHRHGEVWKKFTKKFSKAPASFPINIKKGDKQLVNKKGLTGAFQGEKRPCQSFLFLNSQRRLKLDELGKGA